MIQFIFTTEATWLDRWDQFVNDNERGNHLILSDWLKSYSSYGFDYELSLLVENDQIIGGCGVIIPKFLFFKFYIVPHGPIYKQGLERTIDTHLLKLEKRAKQIGSCYIQISVPISSNEKLVAHTYSPAFADTIGTIFQPGKLFKYVYTSYGINWVDLRTYATPESYLDQLTPKVRRNIRMPYNKKAKASFVTDIDQIKNGYEVIMENANYGGYSVRAFSEFKDTLLNLIHKQQGYFIICEVEKQIKAAAFFVRTSGYITNIMGGVLRDKPDIKLGYMLQWEIIKKSFELGYTGYNISMGGSTGVQEFKSKFGAKPIPFENAHYHLVLNSFSFKLYQFFDRHLKPYKNQISKLLARIKR